MRDYAAGLLNGPGGPLPAFAGTNEMTMPIAANLNKWAQGDLSFLDGRIPPAPGATYDTTGEQSVLNTMLGALRSR